MRVLLIAPYFDPRTPGESWSTYKWVQGISAVYDTTVLTQHREGWRAADAPTQAQRVVNWTEPNLPWMNGRIAWELKPSYIPFYHRARKWIKSALRAGERFDLIHQINPLALRYPSPASGLGIPYILGPLAGSLPTPAGLREHTSEKLWYRRLRALDGLRMKYDPMLRRSFTDAAAVIGVAPYVETLLRDCAPRRFEVMGETGVEQIAGSPRRAPVEAQPFRLVFVGRLIQTKGILEAIDAVARASRRVALRFDVLGDGDLREACSRRITELGLDDIVTLHGRVPRSDVFAAYDRADAFLFPSYREPSGNVVFEAMGRGLPVITSTEGGPAHVVTDSCGIRVAPETREKFVAGLADGITTLAAERKTYASRSQACLTRMAELALWPGKIERLLALYESVAQHDAEVRF